MDDSCVVCAESLEWVAYGPCGHREVCSTCVARLRFICQDCRCCICKTESNVVFVTKAMGDYTRVINDFSALPSEPREGRLGSYWYHEDTQAFFDDVDHYKMIKAMCRLSCSVCDKMEGQPNDGPKRQPKFRNIEQLKGHLFHRHKLLMCSLCLEGRKVFICEQKLYTRAQLNQHIRAGDSEVDGSESERGGFTGHPMCEFCRTPFYGDNELYTHMSTEHYTCHICQRQHPGQYEYYRNYDDLEIHFRRDHFLCEDEACLAKKFIVFTSEAELKRHNAMEHGGHMSRSQRNAALQIPTSFRYRRCNNDQEHRRGRGRTFRRDYSETQLSMAIQASLETANTDGISHDASSTSSAMQPVTLGDVENIDSIVQSMESLAASNSEASSRYLQALGQSSRKVPLEDSSFPPLPVASSSIQQKANHDSEGLTNNTMAARLRRQKRNVTVVHPARGWPAATRGPLLMSNNLTPSWPTASTAAATGPRVSNPCAQAMIQSTTAHGLIGGSSKIWGSNNRISHSSSAPNLADTMTSKPSLSDFPAASSTHSHKVPASSQALLHVEDVQTANKSLVEKMRASLDYDEDKYSAFKDISGRYRQGTIDTKSYLEYVQQFGLWHLVLDLARLCPDTQKQKELVDTYNSRIRSNGTQDNGWASSQVNFKDNQGFKKSKGKTIASEDSNSRNSLADDIITTVRELQSSFHPSEQIEQLSKDGYRTAKGKSKAIVEQQQEAGSVDRLMTRATVQNDTQIGEGSQNSRDGIGLSKQRKKTSKFHRVRLGDGSVGALLDLKNSDQPENESLVADKAPSTGALPVRGAWRRGGSQKLFS